MSKKTIFITISLVVGLALFAGTIKKIGLSSAWETVKNFSWEYFFVVLLVTILAPMVQVFRWQLLLKSQGAKVKWSTLMASFFSGFTLSYLTPVAYLGGEPVRVICLRERSNLKPGLASASVVVDKGLQLSANLLIILLGTFLLFLNFSLPASLIVVIILAVCLLFSLFCLLIFYFTSNQKYFAKIAGWLGLSTGKNHKLEQVEDFIHQLLAPRKKIFWLIVLVDLLAAGLELLRFWLIVFFLGLTLSFNYLLIIGAFLFLVLVIPLPGSFGSLEASQALAFSLLGFASLGLVFSLILRLSDLGKVGIGLFFLIRYNIRELLNRGQ